MSLLDIWICRKYFDQISIKVL